MSSTDEAPDRAVIFSDAVIAIAMTLLAVDLPVPHGHSNAALWKDLAANWPDSYLPFVLSFVVIAAFWHTHHQMFRHVVRLGPGLVPLNFLFLLLIVLLPFVTRVLGADGHYQVGVVLYAFVVAGIATVLGSMVVLITRSGLLAADAPAGELGSTKLAMASTAVVFAVTVPVGFANPRLATWLWLILTIGVHTGERALRAANRKTRFM